MFKVLDRIVVLDAGVSIGGAAPVSLTTGTLVGNSAGITPDAACCIGTGSTALSNAVAVGNGANAGTSSIAVGHGALMTGGKTALGAQATSTFISDFGLGNFCRIPVSVVTASANLTAAALLSGFVRFSPSTSANLAVTFPTSALIYAAMTNPVVGSGCVTYCYNASTAARSVTFSGSNHRGMASLPPSRGCWLYIVVRAATPTVWIRSSYCDNMN